MKVRRSYITLLETLIAMSLLSVLLVLIFGFFREVTTLSNLAEVKEQESFKLRYLDSRLAYLFERIVHEKAKDRTFYFYLDEPKDGVSAFPSLVFTYFNEARADPTLSGDVLARLYVNRDNKLCLAVWPIHALQPWEFVHKEILLEHVEKLDFELYAAPERVSGKNFITTNEVDPNKPERNVWHQNHWPRSFQGIPAIIKLTIQTDRKDREKWEFAFVLPSSAFPIYYPPE